MTFMPRSNFEYAHKHRDEIVWMSQNTNTIPTSPEIEEAIIESAKSREYNLYPYAPGVFGLQEAIYQDLGISPEEFDCLITPGGIEALYILNRALLSRGNNVIASDPSFMPIHHQIRLSRAEALELPVYQEPWKLTIGQVSEAINEKTKMFLLIDPLNPLGTPYTKDEVKAFCDIARDNDLWMIDDITYRDFADEHTLTTDFYPEKTIITYSFSKNCGFAGMRIGALIAPKEVMNELRPFNTNVLSVNIMAQRAALAALETKEQWMGRVVSISRKNQEHIRNCVDAVEGAFLPVYPSHTNMFVIDISQTGIDPDEVEKKMLFDHDVFFRGGNYLSKRFGPRFVRTSFSIPEEQCLRFCGAFPNVIDELRG
ncbi:MAG: pyridoxal phosphate-dependent aminotransferase [Thermoplasmata archaeon]|nr:MAG: pyridoxal phosphate-dependent aminotransferase [Thermoplasmata archaeon]